MATYRILYWQDIPTVIEAQDDDGEVKLSLGLPFEQLVDTKAMEQGLVGSDEFLDHWKYGEEESRSGAAQAVAEAVKKEFEDKFL